MRLSEVLAQLCAPGSALYSVLYCVALDAAGLLLLVMLYCVLY